MKISVIICCRKFIPLGLISDLTENQPIAPYEIIEASGNSLTAGRNAGIKATKGDVILFLDDDVRLDDMYLYAIQQTFKNNPDAMAVTGNVIAPMYNRNAWYKPFYDLFTHIFFLTYRGKGKFLISGFPQNYGDNIRKTIRGEMLNGCNMAIKKEVFNEFHFHEELEEGMFGEDDYFAYELTRKYPIYYNPNAICYDNRPYPKGKQAKKIRATFLNLITRYRNRNNTLIGHITFWWAMLGFTIFKLTEALVMQDISIIKGMLNCFKPSKREPVKVNVHLLFS